MANRIPEGAIQLVVSGGALATSLILPHGQIDGLKLCPIYHITGIECPFCGMTRGFVAMTHLDPLAAIEFNIGTPLIYFAFILILVRSIWSWKNNRLDNLPEIPIKVRNTWLIASIICFGWMMWIRWINPLINYSIL